MSQVDHAMNIWSIIIVTLMMLSIAVGWALLRNYRFVRARQKRREWSAHKDQASASRTVHAVHSAR